MLLCIGKSVGVFEESVEVAGEVALEAAASFSWGLSFGDASSDVGTRIRTSPHTPTRGSIKVLSAS